MIWEGGLRIVAYVYRPLMAKCTTGKLTNIVEVEYYDKTKYDLFKRDWADTTRERGYKIDVYGLVLVNFNHLVHRGELITDEPYTLTSQVDQVFYVNDERNPDWACAVRTKPRNMYDVGQGQGPNDANATYHECEPLVSTSGNLHDLQDEFDHDRPDLAPIEAHVNE
jgi:hypothetical protein